MEVGQEWERGNKHSEKCKGVDSILALRWTGIDFSSVPHNLNMLSYSSLYNISCNKNNVRRLISEFEIY
jgi:hypothetical protein